MATTMDDLKGLEAMLTDEKEDKPEPTLEKALADVALSALGLAKEAMPDKTAPAKKATKPLAKAQAADEEDVDDDEADDEDGDEEMDDTEAFIQELMKKHAMSKARRTPTGKRGLQKAFATQDEQTPVDVSGYLHDELRLREKDRKTLTALQKSLTALVEDIQTERHQQNYVLGLLAKGMEKILTTMADLQAAVPETPVSRYAEMAKAVKANGGREMVYNDEVAARYGQLGKLTPEQISTWKHTGMLPASVHLD
jgi:hypothetical protein